MRFLVDAICGLTNARCKCCRSVSITTILSFSDSCSCTPVLALIIPSHATSFAPQSALAGIIQRESFVVISYVIYQNMYSVFSLPFMTLGNNYPFIFTFFTFYTCCIRSSPSGRQASMTYGSSGTTRSRQPCGTCCLAYPPWLEGTRLPLLWQVEMSFFSEDLLLNVRNDNVQISYIFLHLFPNLLWNFKALSFKLKLYER